MEIAVCDDNIQDLDRLCIALEQYVEQEQLAMSVVRYNDPDAFLQRLETADAPEISFLDIYMGSHSGVSLARAIRQKDKLAVIVFVTSSSDHMAEGFEVGAVHYLLKPWGVADVAQAMSRATQMIGAPVKHLEFTTDRRKVSLPKSKIRYAEVREKYCHIFSTDGQEYVFRSSFSQLIEKLDEPCFLQCHRSFIVNMDYIKTMEKNDFMLEDGTLIPIRTNSRTEIVRQYESYRFLQIRRGL